MPKRSKSRPGSLPLVLALAVVLGVVFSACGTCQRRGGELVPGTDYSPVLLPIDLNAAMPSVRVLLRGAMPGGGSEVEVRTVGPCELRMPNLRIEPVLVSCVWRVGVAGGKLSVASKQMSTHDGDITSIHESVTPKHQAAGLASFTLRSGSPGSFIQIGSRKYHGDMLFSMESGKPEVINTVTMAEYVTGSLASEMPASWHVEALKAQAVAIRTYTLFTLTKGPDSRRAWDVDDTTAFLRYAGFGGEKGDLSKAFQDRVREAENATSGEVMLYQGSIFKAYFHSTSGGHTASCQAAFGQPTIAPLAGSDLGDYGEKSSFHRWERGRQLREVQSAAVSCIPVGAPALGDLEAIEPTETDDGGWPAKLRLTGSQSSAEVSAAAFRRALGTGTDGLPSTNFTASVSRQAVTFTGRGWGHGVGLDQWASNGMANDGKSYRAILRAMYPESEIVRIKS